MTAALCLWSGSLSAQSVPVPPPGAEAVNAEDVTRYLRVFAADSMRPRDTPSPALERAAAYLAAEFQGLGLAPGTDDGAWIQRYELPGQFELDRSRTKILFSATIRREGKPVVVEDGSEWRRRDSVGFATTARSAGDVVDLNIPKRTLAFVPPTVTLIAGPQTPESIQAADLGASYVVYVPPADSDSLREERVVERLLRSSRAVLIVTDEDSATFARRRDATQRRPFRLVDSYMSGRMGSGSWGAYVWMPAVHGLFASAGVDLAAAQTTTRPVNQLLPGFVFGLVPARDTTTGSPATAPNVVAVLEGSDPKLKDDRIALVAHLDTDRDGGGDNAAGVTGLLSLAKAFSQPGARPRRSLVFVAASGGTKDWWGVRAFVTRGGSGYGVARRVMASLHLDAIDQMTGDSVVVDGLRDFSVANSPQWIGAAHPELGLTVADGGPVDRSAANRGAFLVGARPSLSFHAPRSSEPRESATPAAAAASATARLLRLVFYLAHDLADVPSHIGWSDEARRRLRQATDDD